MPASLIAAELPNNPDNQTPQNRVGPDDGDSTDISDSDEGTENDGDEAGNTYPMEGTVETSAVKSMSLDHDTEEYRSVHVGDGDVPEASATTMGVEKCLAALQELIPKMEVEAEVKLAKNLEDESQDVDGFKGSFFNSREYLSWIGKGLTMPSRKKRVKQEEEEEEEEDEEQSLKQAGVELIDVEDGSAAYADTAGKHKACAKGEHVYQDLKKQQTGDGEEANKETDPEKAGADEVEALEPWQSYILSIHGEAGSGKSSIAFAVRDKLEKERDVLAGESDIGNMGFLTPSTAIVFVSLDTNYERAGTYTVHNLLAMALRDVLAQQPIYAAVFQFNNAGKIDVQATFSQVIRAGPDKVGNAKVIFIFDAFHQVQDEVPANEGVEGWVDPYDVFFDDLLAAAKETWQSLTLVSHEEDSDENCVGGRFRLFFSTEGLLEHLEPFLDIDIMDRPAVKKELESLVENSVNKLFENWAVRQDLRAEIRDSVMQSLTGKGLLKVKLLTNEIARLRIPSTPDIIRTELYNFRRHVKNINHIYERLLSRTPVSSREWAAEVLCWVSLARRPLTLEELRYGLALSLGGRLAAKRKRKTFRLVDNLSQDMRSDLCQFIGDLVQITPEDRVILVHLSLADFLVGEFDRYPVEPDKREWFALDTQDGHERLAAACLGFLGLKHGWNEGRFIDKITPVNHDWSYALDSWGYHYEKSKPEGSAVEIKDSSDQLNPAYQFVAFLDLAAGGYSTGYESFLTSKAVHTAMLSMSQSPRRYYPLHVAVANDLQEHVQRLLYEYGDEPWLAKNEKDGDGDYPIHIAARCGHKDLVTTLVDFGADIKARNDKNLTPLHLTAQSGHAETARVILDALKSEKDRIVVNRGVLVDKDGKAAAPERTGGFKGANDTQDTKKASSEPRHEVGDGETSEADSDFVDVDSDFDVSSESGGEDDEVGEGVESPLNLAARGGHHEVMTILAEEAGFDVNEQSGPERYSPLHAAAAAGQYWSIYTLRGLHAEPDPKDAREWTPLHLAAFHSNDSCVWALLDYGANIEACNEDGSTALILAARKDCTDIIRTLSNYKVNLNATNKRSETALHIAVKEGHIGSMKTLVECGADAFWKTEGAKGRARWTPVQEALRSKRPDVADTMIEAVAPTFMTAAKCGDVAGLEKMLAGGVDINIRDDAGRTALFYATQGNDEKAIRFLHSKGIEYWAQDNQHGRVARDMAFNPSTLSLLLKLFEGREELPPLLIDMSDVPEHKRGCQWSGEVGQSIYIYCDGCEGTGDNVNNDDDDDDDDGDGDSNDTSDSGDDEDSGGGDKKSTEEGVQDSSGDNGNESAEEGNDEGDKERNICGLFFHCCLCNHDEGEYDLCEDCYTKRNGQCGDKSHKGMFQGLFYDGFISMWKFLGRDDRKIPLKLDFHKPREDKKEREDKGEEGGGTG